MHWVWVWSTKPEASSVPCSRSEPSFKPAFFYRMERALEPKGQMSLPHGCVDAFMDGEMVSLMCGWMGSSWVICEKFNQVCILIWNAFIENNSMFTVAAFALKQSSINGWLPKLTASNRKMLQMFQIKKKKFKRRPSYTLNLLFHLGGPASPDSGVWCFISVNDRREEVLHISQPVSLKYDMFMCVSSETKIHIWPW